MDDARYHRCQAELCLEIAELMSDPVAAKLLREAATRHLAEATANGKRHVQSWSAPTYSAATDVIGSEARSGDERGIASSSGMSKSASTVKHRISGSRSPAFASSTIFVTTTSVSGSSRSHDSSSTSQIR
jgi:hypothetical protein